ncbi:allantoate permease [Fusarium napiforme]|uniref:Allantoate permease n=1 Tax=Fusarium napiforme TaxID=42672 RepID=A0A8H5NJP2_9HYPO|nr:allantoate permease [Fusarium napiforme]
MTGQGTIKQRRARPENPNGKKQAMTNPSPTTRTVMQHDIVEWRRDNKYILSGYRPLEADYLQVIKSLTFLHNETCNVYTHLIGAALLPLFAVAILRAIYGPQYINVTETDFIMFSVFFCSAESCLIFSAVYHLIGSHSREVEQFWHRMDLLGIVIVTVGTFIPGIYYIFNCEPFLQKIHWAIVILCGSATATLISIPKFRTLRWRKVRVGAYVALSASAFIPLLHGVQVYGLDYMLEYSGMKWYLVELLLYGGGCGLYAFRVPERFAPGQFDIWFSSHQIFHISILCAMFFNRAYAAAMSSRGEYQPLPNNDEPENTMERQEARAENYRDAAAMLLIKMGRSPDEQITISPADDARILRRIDIALLPLMLSVYFLQALDKATLSYASIFGLIEDTNLEGDQYSWLGSIVYLAQLIMQPPLALALVKLPIGKLTSAMVLAWGVTLVLMTWASNFKTLMVARFFLDVVEEKRADFENWVVVLYEWVDLGSLITYGLARIDSKMKPYQIIFLFFGAITVGVSFVMFFWMPDSPTEAKFLTDEDKIIAIERLRNNQMGVMSREWRMSHVVETLKDLKTWCWVAMIFCISVPSNGISTFGPLIIKSFVSDPFETMLFNVPVGVSHIIAVSASAYIAMKWKLKGPVIVMLCIPPIVGCAIMLHFEHNLENKGVLLAGYFCLCTYTGITPLIYSWSAQNTAGDTKRKSTSALIFISASAGNIVGPLLYSPDEAPAYTRGLRSNLALYIVVIALVVVTSLHLARLNRLHSQRRVALGKSAVLVDRSLETAEEAERIEHMERSLRGGVLREAEDNEDGRVADVGDLEGDRADRKDEDKGFGDITDLENEDFLFVF